MSNLFDELNDKKINFVISPKGYGKCYKEYKNVIDYLEDRIKQLENNRDKAIEIIKKDYYKLNSRNIDEISDTKTDIRITLYNILKGDSDE